jgi:hypothetical protein
MGKTMSFWINDESRDILGNKKKKKEIRSYSNFLNSLIKENKGGAKCKKI